MSNRGLQAAITLLACAGMIAVVTGVTAMTGGQVPQVGGLISISVDPPLSTVSVGNQLFLKVTGHFEGGDRILGGGGSSAQWSIQFQPALAVTACTDPPAPTTLCCQNAHIAADSTFHAAWPPSQPLVSADGSLTPGEVHAELACHPDTGISGPIGTIDAAWNGTRYTGTFSFANAGNVVVTGLTWSSSDPSVALVDARGVVTTVGPGTTTISATYGATCWAGEPAPPGGCAGTVTGSATVTATAVVCPPHSLDSLTASPDVLWPPNRMMVEIALSGEISNPCDRPITCQIVSVTSNEPEPGDAEPDWEIIHPLSLKLRAERMGSGQGRAYTVVVSCTDDSGNTSTRAVVVTVPHTRR